jgi:hypothetical protein
MVCRVHMFTCMFHYQITQRTSIKFGITCLQYKLTSKFNFSPYRFNVITLHVAKIELKFLQKLRISKYKYH